MHFALEALYNNPMRKGWLLNLRDGPIPYGDAWVLQKALIGARQRDELADGLILLEHEPVFTIGRSARADHLLVPREFLTGKGFGVTNLVVLDSDGSPIIDEQVTVVRQAASSVRI